MGFPVSYFTENGFVIEGAARAKDAYALSQAPGRLGRAKLGEAIELLNEVGLVVTLARDPFPSQIARVKIDVYGESAADVEKTLLEYATRCDAASQADSVSYGQCVIERNLAEEWGALFSWRGRITLHPSLAMLTAEGDRVSAEPRPANGFED